MVQNPKNIHIKLQKNNSYKPPAYGSGDDKLIVFADFLREVLLYGEDAIEDLTNHVMCGTNSITIEYSSDDVLLDYYYAGEGSMPVIIQNSMLQKAILDWLYLYDQEAEEITLMRQDDNYYVIR